MKKLTPTHWDIYNAVKEGGKLTQRELCSLVQGLTFVEKATNCKNDAKGDHCKPLLRYIKEINESPEVEKIVVIENYTYRLGNEEDCIKYYQNLMLRAVTMLNKAQAVKRKMLANGYGKLISCQGKEITEGSGARPFVEAYPNG